MKLVLASLLLLSVSHASAAVSQDCLAKAGHAALAKALQSQGVGLTNGFRSLRLGMDGSQGDGAEKDSPYQIGKNSITVIVTTANAMNSQSSQDEEIKYAEFYQVQLLDAPNCRLGKVSNVTPE